MMTIKQAAAALQIDWLEKDVSFTGVSTDSRTLKSGDLFIALSGKNFEGGKFVSNAIKQGAVAAIVNENVTLDQPTSDVPILKVKDTRYSLGQLAAFWRNQFTLPRSE